MANDDEDSHWVTVATFDNGPLVHLTRARLESAGIPCALLNEYTLRMWGHRAPDLGGIQLQVREHDVEAALDLLEES